MLASFLSDMIDEVRGGISPRKVGEALKVPMSDLARIAQVHRNTLAHRPESPVVQARLGEIAGIITAATELTGDRARAIVWFRHQPLAGFGGRTAEALVADGHADAVKQHIEMLRDGGYA
jgi:uncharacterized protein (DUF2384 family)